MGTVNNNLNNRLIKALEKQIETMQIRIKVLEDKCLTCPMVAFTKQTGDTWKSVVVICLTILGAIIGFKVVP